MSSQMALEILFTYKWVMGSRSRQPPPPPKKTPTPVENSNLSNPHSKVKLPKTDIDPPPFN